MAGFNTDSDRNVIPRLRTFETTRALGELDSLVEPLGHDRRSEGLLVEKIAAWRQHGTIGHASDLVGTALTLGRVDGDIEAAAKLLAGGKGNVSRWAQELGETALGTSDSEGDIFPTQNAEEGMEDERLRKQVKTFRMLLKRVPRDPVTWVDLAFAYACLGHRERAAKAMTVAMQLSKDNRFILRSAGRLWIYLDDPEKAYQVVARSKRTMYDPWLLAAELALGSIVGKGRRHVKKARLMVGGRQFGAMQISELASALATLELHSGSTGSTKKAKRLFARSLEEPTENSVAQASWAARRYKVARVDLEYLRQRNTGEAAAWTCYQNKEWHDVVRNSKRWFEDQPFSTEPAGLGSFVATTALEDYPKGRRFAENGLRANPGDFTLLNNLAFACLQLGDVRTAEDALRKIKHSDLSEDQAIVSRRHKGS